MTLMRRIPLAWRNLTHDWRRLAVAISGIGFAVVLMFMQTGFKNALFDSTVQIVNNLDADILLTNRTQYALPAQQRFSRTRIDQARSCAGVKAVYPLYIEVYHAVWRQPGGKGYPIRVLACEPSDPVLEPAMAIYRLLLGREFSPLSSVTVETVNGVGAGASPFANELRKVGFANDYRGMSLWKR